MKHFTTIKILLGLLVCSADSVHAARLKVITAYPYIASITKEIAGNDLEIQSLANGKWDPHFIVPRPSYIARLRSADLLIINGGDLEVGWIPPLVTQAGNTKLNGDGTLDLSRFVQLQEPVQDISRKLGDIHPAGNPHFHLDPDNVVLIAQAVKNRLTKLDPDHAADYDNRTKVFLQKWKEHTAVWEKSLATLKGSSLIQYHNLFHYFLRRFQIQSAGTIERLPGIPPTADHIESLGKIIHDSKITKILQDVYHPDDAAKHIAAKHKIELVYLPHDVDSMPGTEDIFALFNTIVKRLVHD